MEERGYDPLFPTSLPSSAVLWDLMGAGAAAGSFSCLCTLGKEPLPGPMGVTQAVSSVEGIANG